MRFGDTALEDAQGAILAHSVKASGTRFNKGRILSAEDIAVLRAAGHERLVTARLDEGDVHEDAAADAVATMVTGPGLRRGGAFTGRCNLFASHAGLLVIDEERIERLNRVDEAVTVATLANHQAVQPKQMVATIKIIPFAIARASLVSAREVASGAEAALRVLAFQSLRVGLIQTRLPATRESVLDKTRRVIEDRLSALGAELAGEIRSPHEQSAVAGALGTLLARPIDLVLLLGASAIVDRRDVIPAGIEAAGGVVRHFGMPVDPGNLLLLAQHSHVPVLGLPGCARSPKFNGFDQVLQRIAAGMQVESRDIVALGVGGLLKEIAERPQPRGAKPQARAPARAPRVAAVVLAAGQSRRMGRVNKLLAEIDGVPMVRRVVDAALAAAVEGVYVVTGHEHARVEAALAGRPVELVPNPEYAGGLSTSLGRGIAALPPEVEAALVCLGDMPLVTPADLDRLIAAFDPGEGRAICVPTFDGKRGNPVLWSSRYFPEMQSLRGDVGARHLIGEYAEAVCEVAVDRPAVLTDVDSPAELESVRGALGE